MLEYMLTKELLFIYPIRRRWWKPRNCFSQIISDVFSVNAHLVWGIFILQNYSLILHLIWKRAIFKIKHSLITSPSWNNNYLRSTMRSQKKVKAIWQIQISKRPWDICSRSPPWPSSHFIIKTLILTVQSLLMKRNFKRIAKQS